MESMFPLYLLHGYCDFRTGRYRKEKIRYQKLAESGQKPPTLLIACCDSRAAPETIFNASPGELFVVRNVAALVPPYEPDSSYHGVSAALEFGIMSLKVRHIVVMGHGRCGGVHAALNGSPKAACKGDFIGKWVSLLSPVVSSGEHEHEADPHLRQKKVERSAVVHSIHNLRTFPWIKDLESQGLLSIHGAWFDIADGRLYTFAESKNEWAASACNCDEHHEIGVSLCRSKTPPREFPSYPNYLDLQLGSPQRPERNEKDDK